MNRIEQVFTNGRALMAHVYFGDPTPKFSIRQIKAMVAGGVDIIELGIPFSDPTADGPVFQDACKRALARGTTPEDVFDGLLEIRGAGIESPVVITTYYNIVQKMGEQKFVSRIAGAGADGVIVPDLPLEESQKLQTLCKEADLSFIYLIAPTTTGERLAAIAEQASGFIYLVSVTGVTGARENLSTGTGDLISKVKDQTDVPVLVGFGVSTPEHAGELVNAGADGVIVGSAFGKLYEGNLGSPEGPEASLSSITSFASSIKDALI